MLVIRCYKTNVLLLLLLLLLLFWNSCVILDLCLTSEIMAEGGRLEMEREYVLGLGSMS